MTMPRIALGGDGYAVARLLIGGWQLSGGHRSGSLDERALFGDLLRLVRAGWTTFDCADIYTGVEELLGRFADEHRAALARDGIELGIHTKYVPDKDALAGLRREDVESAVDRSLRRLRTERLDLVQFAWWDYAVPGYVDAALWLSELQRSGKIRHVGATNFDVASMRAMLAAGVPLVANQVQYSLLDRRPEQHMSALAAEHGFGLFCYGALAGGLLSERYVGVAPEALELSNRSLVKYRLIVDEFGGWEPYQRLLGALSTVAERHAVTIPAVALRWALDRPAVAGVIVGTYHGRHADANQAAVDLALDDGDRAVLDAVLEDCPGPSGDVWDLERDERGPHARIMWTNLNREG